MQCNKCRNRLNEGVKFCPNCGTFVKASPLQSPLSYPPTNYPTSNYPHAGTPPANYPPTGYPRYSAVYMENNLPAIGAALGIGTGMLAIIGWFLPWGEHIGGNGFQIIALPFYFLHDDVSWIMAIISIGLAVLCLLSIMAGVKCLGRRVNPAALPLFKNNIRKLRAYGLVGIIALVVVLLLINYIGAFLFDVGVVLMFIAFMILFIGTIFLKP